MDTKRRTKAFILALFGIAGLIFIFTINPRKKKWNSDSGIAWNTEYNIKYYHDRPLSDSIVAIMRRVELSVSPFNRNSLITAINENATDSLDEYLLRLYRASAIINKESGGAFDPTISPVINAWGFGYKQNALPDSAAIDSLMQFVGLGKTHLANNRIVKDDSRTSFNFSAIAKGMGSDEVGRMLERNGVENYLVEIGGEIVAKGSNPSGGKWRISIDKPVASADSVVHDPADIIAVENCGIATSGNYRNYRTSADGKRYAHTINPVTGYPEQTDVLSATVIAPECMTADAYATTFMVLGSKRSKLLLSKHPELSALLIIAEPDGSTSLWESPDFPKPLK